MMVEILCPAGCPTDLFAWKKWQEAYGKWSAEGGDVGVWVSMFAEGKAAMTSIEVWIMQT